MLKLALLLALVAVQDARIDHDPALWWSGAGGWRVIAYPEEEMCDIGFPTAAGEYVTLGYAPRLRKASLLVTNRHATSLRVGEVRRLLVGFASAPGQPFGHVHRLSFHVVEAEGKLALTAETLDMTTLEDFGRSGVMAVLTPERRVVAAIALTGSAKAVAELRACANHAAKVDPRDPFLPG